MVDFKLQEIIRLKQCRISEVGRGINSFLVKGEIIVLAFNMESGWAVFTNKRIILVNLIDGLHGRINYTSLPYKKASSFSFENSEENDIPVRLAFSFPELGEVKFEIVTTFDTLNLNRVISSAALS